jgi:hypothetical protein
MFVRHRLVVGVPFEGARQAFEQIVAEYGRAGAHGEQALPLTQIGFDVPPIHVRKQVEMKFSDLLEVAPEVLTARLDWRAAGQDALFPVWEGRLELAGHGSGRTLLTVGGNYFPPLGRPGESIDRLLLNRIAKASIADFVERLAAAITSRASTTAGGDTGQ